MAVHRHRQRHGRLVPPDGQRLRRAGHVQHVAPPGRLDRHEQCRPEPVEHRGRCGRARHDRRVHLHDPVAVITTRPEESRNDLQSIHRIAQHPADRPILSPVSWPVPNCASTPGRSPRPPTPYCRAPRCWSRFPTTTRALALAFEATAVDGALSKLSSQVWSGDCEASGTASFYRLVDDADDGTESTDGAARAGLHRGGRC